MLYKNFDVESLRELHLIVKIITETNTLITCTISETVIADRRESR
jgi:hypothetical protein